MPRGALFVARARNVVNGGASSRFAERVLSNRRRLGRAGYPGNAARLSVMKDIRAGQADICSREMDFHIHVVRRRGRIHI